MTFLDPLEPMRRELERPLPHPEGTALQELAGQTVAWLLDHFATLPEQSVGNTGTRPQLEAMLRERAPEEGQAFEEVLREFGDKVSSHAIRVNHPRFLAFVPGAPTFPSVLGDWLCAGTNFFAGVWLEAAGPTQVELIVLDWFKEFLGYPSAAQGILTSGGSEANLTALLVARERLSWEERASAVLYVTEQRHWSIDRAAKVAGLRPDQVRPVPADDDFRLTPTHLRSALRRDRDAGLRPWAVVANAGATNTGTVDPMEPLADLCREEQLWLHVDAAYGWPAVLIPEGRAELAGIGRADSITLDPHKWFGQTFEAGCLLVRDGRRLTETFSLRPDYMQDVEPGHDEVNFADRGIALTRRFRALKIWLSVKVLGVDWHRRLVARCCRLADYAEALLRQTPGFEILCSRRLSVVCFRSLGAGSIGSDRDLDQFNLALIDKLRATGRAFMSSTRLRGCVALRLCFVNWRTTAADVEEVVGLLQQLTHRG